MRNSYTLIFIFLMTSCSMMNSFNGPSALATNDFIQALELLRKNRKEDALLKFENSCEAHVLAACLYLGNDIDHKKLRPFSIMQGMTGNKEALLSILFTTSKNNIIEIYDETSGKLVSSSNI
ncbi:MAG: hypothetical protein HN576_01830, partial [Bacteriovoracaceae bacterium]|nr:hypothetical protein [Bacteriovoracaceae bacterium]